MRAGCSAQCKGDPQDGGGPMARFAKGLRHCPNVLQGILTEGGCRGWQVSCPPRPRLPLFGEGRLGEERANAALGDGITTLGASRKEEDVLLDVQREVEEVHDLC